MTASTEFMYLNRRIAETSYLQYVYPVNLFRRLALAEWMAETRYPTARTRGGASWSNPGSLRCAQPMG